MDLFFRGDPRMCLGDIGVFRTFRLAYHPTDDTVQTPAAFDPSLWAQEVSCRKVGLARCSFCSTEFLQDTFQPVEKKTCWPTGVEDPHVARVVLGCKCPVGPEGLHESQEGDVSRLGDWPP